MHAQEILNLKKRLNEIYVKHTGQTYKAIEDALERDKFLTADMRQIWCKSAAPWINDLKALPARPGD